MQLRVTAESELVRVLQGPFEIRDFPCVWRRRLYEPAICIGHDSGKFIYNGTIEAEFGKFPFEDDVEKIKSVITDCGWTVLKDGDLDAEFAVASRYFMEQSTLADELTELRRLETVKKEFVSRQDFEHAARIRDQQDAIRNRIDALAMSLYRLT